MKLPFLSKSDDQQDRPQSSNGLADQIGKLKPIQRAGVMVLAFGLALFGGYWFDLSTSLQALDDGRAQEAQLKDSFLSKKAQAVNLSAYKKQLKDIEATFSTLLRELPNKSEMDDLLDGINQAGLGHGLQFEMFRPDPNEKLSEFYAEQPVAIRIDGSYSDIGAFAEDVSRLPRIVNLDGITISVIQAPSKTSPQAKLSMDATARTYRYLDANEMARARSSASKGAK